jgi:FlaA1/EpsC-like NDP-sugar epimerase
MANSEYVKNGALRDDALKGRTIIVTGGGTGLGKAMSTYFLQLEI